MIYKMIFSLFVLLMLMVNSASARPWYAEPAVSVSAGYDDNPSLINTTELDDPDRQPEALDDQSFVLLGGDLRIGSETEADLLAFDLSTIIRRYNDSALDSELAGLTAIYAKNGIKHDFGFQGGVSRDSTLETEIEDSGILEFDVDRDTYFVQPTLTTRFSELLVGTFELNHRDISFDGGDETFTDFNDFGGSAQLNRVVSERFSAFGQVNFLRYKPTGNINLGEIERDDFTSIQLGVNYDLTEQLALNLSAGRGLIKTNRLGDVATGNQETVSSEENNTVYNAGLSYSGERNTLSAVISNTFNSSAEGGLSETQNYSFGLSRPETLGGTFNIRAVYIARDPISGEGEARDSYSLRPSIVWQLNQNLSISTRLVYREQEERNTTTNATERADSSSAVIGLRYNFGRKRISY